MLRTHGFSLSSRVILVNGVLFALGTALLAFSPASVSPEPLLSEVVVLLVGLSVMILANSLLVRSMLRPLEQLSHDLDRARSTEPIAKVPVARAGIARQLATAVNDLLARIEIGRKESQLAALAAQEAERARIAQELHDSVGQSLTVVLLELKAVAGRVDADAQLSLEGTRETVRASLDEVRTVARQLRPHVLEDLGLRSALASLTTKLFSERTHVERGIAPGLPELDDHVELVIFRVAQEALTNVARHAHASTVDLRLSKVGNSVVLLVEDDGLGIAPGVRGTGIRGMEERAALVDATLEVTRREGRGTRVRLAVPIGDTTERADGAGEVR
ncbi:two-component system sensor histidine kinase UhpB [Nocardioides daedukensis]|uniref:histidine kinase n=1 Tax=Nocardioides daedukensis TaxID=634462 RepID=A0A7Y9UQH2_9ACTN|nr:sensor histidine kinase [Nocardioides daedukensis]NYG60643.1 two-component system sensor histidine kinase UhpB [Nocardioides daedukensis]